MKKSLLLLIPTLFLVAACNQSKPANDVDPSDDPIPQPEPEPEPEPQPDPGPHVDPCPEGEHIDANQDMVCDKCGYPVEYQHAASLSGTPNAPFYLKVGEQKELKAELSPVPQRDIEKTFTWSCGDSKKAKVTVNSSNSAKAIVEGVSEGKVTISAQNDYRSDFRKDFYANVIDYDADNTYLWEFKSDDRKQFGYVYQENPAGNTKGVATLGGLNWEFTRSSAESLQSSMGAVGFGKGGAPENVKLINHNTRAIKKIFIETASANSLAKITVKVGDNVVIDNKETPSASDDFIGSVSTGNLENLTGDISIEYETPAYDPARAEDPTYKKPGATYLKSIWITYEEAPFIDECTFDFEEMYNDPNSILSKNITSTSGKAFTITSNYYDINFTKIRNSDDKGNEYFEINSNIDIVLKKTDKVIKSVEFEWEILGNKNKFTVSSSVLGGEPFLNPSEESNTGSISKNFSENTINAVRLGAGNTTYVGLKSIKLIGGDGEHCSIKDVSYSEGSMPTKVNYDAGEVFDPAGLPNLSVSFINEGVDPIEVPNELVKFYDGTSYNASPDHADASEILQDGTTEIVCVFMGKECRITGITVKTNLVTLKRVDAINDLTSGDYLFVIPGSKNYWMGSMSNSDLNSKKAIGNLSEISIDSTLTAPSVILNETISISVGEGIYEITSKAGGKVGLTDKGNLSISGSGKTTKWSAAVTEGIVDFSIAGADEVVKHLVFTNQFDVDLASTNNIALYKLAE